MQVRARNLPVLGSPKLMRMDTLRADESMVVADVSLAVMRSRATSNK
jgi:hypothetical protein